jgi:hypothetical protein
MNDFKEMFWLVAMYVLGAAAILVMYGCGTDMDRTQTTNTRTEVRQCSVHKDDTKGETTIACDDGTTAVVKDGKAGQNGSNGSSGSNGVDGQKGDKGDQGIAGTDGKDGAQGPQGIQGIQGIAGTSCEVEQLSNGAMITCADSKAVVLNGVDGKDGINSVTKLIAPCGNESSPWKEQLICLNDGTLLASFSANMSGLDTRFSIIPTGSYIDTDESGCYFNVKVDENNNSTVYWNAGSNKYSKWDNGEMTCKNNGI